MSQDNPTTLILRRDTYKTSDPVFCAGCNTRLLVRHLVFAEGGEASCPECEGKMFRFSKDHQSQRIRQQCISDYSPKKDPFTGIAEFTVRLEGRVVKMKCGEQVIVESKTARYEDLFDKVEKYLKVHP